MTCFGWFVRLGRRRETRTSYETHVPWPFAFVSVPRFPCSKARPSTFSTSSASAFAPSAAPNARAGDAPPRRARQGIAAIRHRSGPRAIRQGRARTGSPASLPPPPERQGGPVRLVVAQALTAPSSRDGGPMCSALPIDIGTTALGIVRGAGLGVRFGWVAGSQSGVVAAALHSSALAWAGERGEPQAGCVRAGDRSRASHRAPGPHRAVEIARPFGVRRL